MNIGEENPQKTEKYQIDIEEDELAQRILGFIEENAGPEEVVYYPQLCREIGASKVSINARLHLLEKARRIGANWYKITFSCGGEERARTIFTRGFYLPQL